MFTAISAVWVKRDYRKKEALGYRFVKGEISMTAKSIVKLAVIGFMAGFLNAGFGLGTTFVINPALIKMDQLPLVAGNTGIFMSMINNISSSIAVIIFGRANLAYGLIICIMSAVGAIPGIVL